MVTVEQLTETLKSPRVEPETCSLCGFRMDNGRLGDVTVHRKSDVERIFEESQNRESFARPVEHPPTISCEVSWECTCSRHNGPHLKYCRADDVLRHTKQYDGLSGEQFVEIFGKQ